MGLQPRGAAFPWAEVPSSLGGQHLGHDPAVSGHPAAAVLLPSVPGLSQDEPESVDQHHIARSPSARARRANSSSRWSRFDSTPNAAGARPTSAATDSARRSLPSQALAVTRSSTPTWSSCNAARTVATVSSRTPAISRPPVLVSTRVWQGGGVLVFGGTAATVALLEAVPQTTVCETAAFSRCIPRHASGSRPAAGVGELTGRGIGR